MRKNQGCENTQRTVLLLIAALTMLTFYFSPYLGQWVSSPFPFPSPSPSSSPNSTSAIPISDKVTVETKKCDIFKGQWVPNPEAPYYTNETCSAIDDKQNCMKFGRPDTDYMKWRWKPNDCELAIFNPAQFLELMRDKSMAFVGDSVGRNQMESLMCLLSRVEKVMSSNSEYESESSSSNESLSITKRLLDAQEEHDDSISSKMSQTLFHTVSIYVPTAVSTMFTDTKRPPGGSVFGRRYIHRERKERHDLIMNDYFRGENSKYTAEQFRRRFRMDVELFNRILNAIGNHDDYFTPKIDAVGKCGLSPLQKMIAALRMLAYGCPADLLDEYVQIGESTAIESLKRFCDAIIGVFEEQYLRRPNDEDVERLLKEGEERGFPGMLGSLDCMHWHWKNCPTAWHGTHTNGFKRVPTLILEVVASRDLWIWHAFFGMAGTNNDINVLNRSPLFDDIINGVAPPCNYVVNGHHYYMGYYLSDGIYPSYATLIQTISEPSSKKEQLFAKRQEAVRKDVERAFGVLQSRWHIVKGPARMWNAKDLGKIMKTCIILHNMIIESERRQGIDPETWVPHVVENNENIDIEHDYAFLVSRMIDRLKKVRSSAMHEDLKIDLINHLWDMYGDAEA